MFAQPQKIILLVSKDAELKRSICALAAPEGGEVVQADVGEIALRMFFEPPRTDAASNPSLIIIDEQTLNPGSTQLILNANSDGNAIPVIYMYEQWLDTNQFVWLRDILKVSLLMNKPLQPQQFLQAMQMLLSGKMNVRASAAQNYESVESIRQKKLGQSVNQIEEQITKTIEKLRKEVVVEWDELSEAAKAYELCPHSTEKKKALATLAHKLRGTAGSLGLKQVSSRAGEIEDWLNLFAPRNGLDYQVWWQAICANLDAGRSCMEIAETPAENQKLPAHPSLILIGCDDDVADSIAEHCGPLQIDVVPKDKALSFLRGLNSSSHHSLVFDLDAIDEPAALALIEKLAKKPLTSKLSTFLLTNGETTVDSAALFYAGISATINKPVYYSALRALIDRANDGEHVENLLVGEGANTEAIFNQLSKSGNSVELLTEPAKLFDTLEEIEPINVILSGGIHGFLCADLAAVIRKSEPWHTLNIIEFTDFDEQTRLLPALCKVLRKNRLKSLSPYTDKSGLLNPDVFMRRSEKSFQNAKAREGSFSLCLMALRFENSVARSVQGRTLDVLSRLLRLRFPQSAFRAKVGENDFALSTDHDDISTVNASIQLMAAEFKRELGKKERNISANVDLEVTISSFPTEEQTWSSLSTKVREKLMDRSTMQTAAVLQAL